MPRRLASAFAWLLLSIVPVSAIAQQGPDAAPGADEPQEPVVRERTIYIPYQRLRSLFEKEGRGVFVPYETFRQLWDAARRAEQTVPPDAIRHRALIGSIDSRATVAGDVVVVRSEAQVELLDEGWHEIPLRLMGAALRSATIDGRPARLHQAEDGSRFLLEKNPTNEPRQLVLVLEYATAYRRSPGRNEVAFHPPAAPIHRWRIEVPEAGAEITVQPDVAVRPLTEDELNESPPGTDESEANGTADDATEGNDDTTDTESARPERTAVEAFVGGADLVGFSWTAKAEGAAGLTALVTAQSRQEMTIDEGVVRTRVEVAYDISRADVSRLTLEVPGDHDIVNVFDPNVQKWEKRSVDGVQRIDVTLFQPTRGNQSLVIELEQFTGGREMMVAMVQAELQAAMVRALEAGSDETMVPVGRQQGIVVVKIAPSLRSEVFDRAGLVQIDASQLPAPLDRQTWDHAYRFAAVPYALGLRVEKLLPEIATQELVELLLTPELLQTRTTVLFDVTRAGIFQVELDVPEGDRIEGVEGIAVPGGEAASIESHELRPAPADGSPATLTVRLSRQHLGRFGLQVRTRRDASDPNLQRPTGTSSEIGMGFPRVATRTTLRSRGRLIVSAPGSLRFEPRRSTGVRPAVQETDPFEVPRNGLLASDAVDVGQWAFGRDPVDLAYAVQRRRPYVTLREFRAVEVTSGVAKYSADLSFDVLYSGVERLRLDVPADLADSLINEDGTLRERAFDPQPDDVAEGMVAWELTGEGELLGTQRIVLTWERPLGELPVGVGTEIPVPAFAAPEANRYWGQIVGRKAESIEIGVRGETVGLRPIDPRNDLIEGFDSEGVARAFEFQGGWNLSFEATRYELEEVKRTSIEKGLVRMIVTRSDEVAVQAIYKLRSARQRIAVRLPGVDPADTADSLDAQPLRIDGRPVPLERDDGQFYIPFTGHVADVPAIVELRYTVPRGGRLIVPEFTEDPAAQKIDLSIYLPEELAIVRQTGSWSRPDGYWFDQEFETPEDAELSQQGTDFPLDGRRYRFTTLRPVVGDEGGLGLTTIDRRRLDVGVAIIVILLGIVLAWQPLGLRFLSIGTLLVVALGLVVVEPWGAKAILRWPLFGAIGVVLAGWTAQGAIWTIARGADWLGRSSRSGSVPPTSGAASAAQDGVESIASGSVVAASPVTESRVTESTVPPATPDAPASSASSDDRPAGDSGKES